MVTGGRIVAQIRHAALVGAVLIAAATGSALSAEPAPPAVARPVAAPQRQAVSPKVRAILREVSARRIERSIQKLVSFGTRHTLSSSDDPRRGIGAARDWIYTELQHAAAASPGRMTVVKQSFIPPPEPWDPGAVPVTDLVATLRAMPPVTNLVATLSGAQPASARRVYVISGHYDSRCKDELNVTCDAPGADDDASGVAAVLELARVMAKRTFDATIVFMAVAGEEQALYGSTYFAQQTRQQGVDIEGMFTSDIIGSSTGDRGQRDPFTVRVFSDGVTTSETCWSRCASVEAPA